MFDIKKRIFKKIQVLHIFPIFVGFQKNVLKIKKVCHFKNIFLKILILENVPNFVLNFCQKRLDKSLI